MLRPPTFTGPRMLEPTMTVAELILALSELDPKLPVISEGCDCYGPVLDVILGEGEDGLTVHLMREKQ